MMSVRETERERAHPLTWGGMLGFEIFLFAIFFNGKRNLISSVVLLRKF